MVACFVQFKYRITQNVMDGLPSDRILIRFFLLVKFYVILDMDLTILYFSLDADID